MLQTFFKANYELDVMFSAYHRSMQEAETVGLPQIQCQTKLHSRTCQSRGWGGQSLLITMLF